MIKMQGLTKTFGEGKTKVTALDGLSLDASNGRVTGLIGPNGAGKTTAFRIVYGLLSADSGHASVDGIDVGSERMEAQRALGVLPDVRGLYPRLTAREHIRYFGELHGADGSALEDDIDDLIKRLGMEDFADRRAKGFSRGQELKVALGRALVHRPKNLILDEPTNGLDVMSSRSVRDLIKEMRDDGHCILISSHIMSEVAVLCDDLVIIANGHAIAAGTPDELRQQTGADDIEEVFVRAVIKEQGAAI
ncbi:MAG: ATP-binding cassette domain-containing protein [Rhodospirillaceae bacterium]|nr:ATP-binding cassette domain-containing protein [Rhodospirillaceae bacterium]MCK5545880.1 ATP-binding cassette domain-containing protein [Rhodospirillaceae bacterium]